MNSSGEMVTKAAKTAADSLTVMERRHTVAPATHAAPPAKEFHREQFLSAMRLVSRELAAVQMDLMQLTLSSGSRIYLMSLLDDHSRFVLRNWLEQEEKMTRAEARRRRE